jgi:hypothetical protein
MHLKGIKSAGRNVMLLTMMCTLPHSGFHAQNTETTSLIYNTVLGSVTGGIGSVINRNKDERMAKAFLRGFIGGGGGGVLSYTGKRMTWLAVEKHDLGWLWPSRMVFSAGNSIVENAAAGRKLWSRWHYDIGFFRLEYAPGSRPVAKVMASAFVGFVLTAVNSEPDWQNSLAAGTLLLRRRNRIVATGLTAVTAGNSILMMDHLSGDYFQEVFAHEMVHVYQFQEFSGVNYYFGKQKSKWDKRFPVYHRLGRYLYGDLNYEFMLVNYFLFQKGYKSSAYCNNFLEQEAEYLSNKQCACP